MITPEMITAEIARVIGQPASEFPANSVLTELIIDSLDFVEIVLGVQERFGVRLMQADLREIETLAELITLVLSRAATQTIPLNPALPLNSDAPETRTSSDLAHKRGTKHNECANKGEPC